MSLPSSWNTVRRFGTWKNFDDGSPSEGDITFDPMRVVTTPEGSGRTIVMPRPRTVALNSSGEIDIQLPATDDTDLNSVGWVYKVTERIAPSNRVYYMDAKLSDGEMDMADVVPLVPPENLVSTQGPPGKSAYQFWLDDGNTGTEEDFVASLGGVPGPGGDSAYAVAVENGFVGSEAAWLASLQGDEGDAGASAYEAAVANGFVGSEAAWLASLQGDEGDAGASAYEVAVANGFVGSEAAWLASLQGDEGDTGASAYEVAVANGFVGDEAAWLASLQGADSEGAGDVIGPAASTTGHVAVFADGTGKELADGGALGSAAFVDTGDFDASGSAVTAENNAKAYADTLVVGMLDDRGNHDASGNAFPTTGGSGTAGAILKGDLWTISVAGTLGGVAVTVGDVIRALVDAPASSAAWVITENNLGYVPEAAQTAASQAEAEAGSETAIRKFSPLRIFQAIAAFLTAGTWISGATAKTTPVDADTVALSDSASSNALKKLTWANVKATLKTYFDTLYLALAGGTMSGAINCADNNLQRPILLDYAVTRQAKGSISGAQTIDITAGNAVSATATGAIAWTFSNPAPTGNLCAVFLRLTNGGAGAQTWPSGTVWDAATAPTLSASGVDELLFLTSDAGTSWRGFLCAKGQA